MTAAEQHQQELEHQEYLATTANLTDKDGRDINLHVWGDEDTVYINAKNWPVSIALYLNKDQARVLVKLINNAI